MITFNPIAQRHQKQSCVYNINKSICLQPKDSISFSENEKFKPIKLTKEYIETLILKQIQDDIEFEMPKIRYHLDFGFGKNRYDISLNTFLISDNQVRKKKEQIKFDKTIQQITQFAQKHRVRMNELIKKSCEITGLKEKDHPKIYLCYEESNPIGRFLENKNAILFNTYWLNSALNPDILIASTMLHEMSHCKTKQGFASIDPDKFKEALKKHPELQEKLKDNPSWLNQIGHKKSDPKTSDRNLWHYIKNLQNLFIENKSQLTGLKSCNTIKEIKKEIANLCNLQFIEITGLRLDKLVTTNKIESNANISNVLFTNKKQQQINEKLNTNKPAILKLLKPHKETIIRYYEDANKYRTIYDEALARFNSGIGILKMIQEGILPDTKINKKFAIGEMNGLQELILGTDEEVKELIKTGKLNLDPKTLEFAK